MTALVFLRHFRQKAYQKTHCQDYEDLDRGIRVRTRQKAQGDGEKHGITQKRNNRTDPIQDLLTVPIKLELRSLRASIEEGALHVRKSAQNMFKDTSLSVSHQKERRGRHGWQGLVDKPLYGATPGIKHAEGIDILAIVQVTLCAVLRVQPVSQRLESSFSWALVFVHHLRVDERDGCNRGHVSALVHLNMVCQDLPYSCVFF